MTCPECFTIPALDGSCCCEHPVAKPIAPTPAGALRAISLDAYGEPVEIPPADKPLPIPSRDETAAQLRDLPDLYLHITLRATTAMPGASEGRSGGDPAWQSPASLFVLHVLDERRHARGDDVPRWLAEDERHYAHPDREPDQDGSLGLIPALEQWADMMAADLDGWEPGIESDPPTDGTGTIIELCDWMAHHLTSWQAVSPEAAPLLGAGVRRWHRALRTELGETDPVPLRHSNLGGCGGRLLPLADGIRHECVDCHEVLTPGEMLGLARWQAEVTLPQAAALLRVNPDRLRKWKERHPEEFPAPVRDGWPPVYRMYVLRDAWNRRGA